MTLYLIPAFMQRETAQKANRKLFSCLCPLVVGWVAKIRQKIEIWKSGGKYGGSASGIGFPDHGARGTVVRHRKPLWLCLWYRLRMSFVMGERPPGLSFSFSGPPVSNFRLLCFPAFSLGRRATVARSLPACFSCFCKGTQPLFIRDVSKHTITGNSVQNNKFITN